MKKITYILIAVLATTTAAVAIDTPVSQLTFSTNSNNEIVITSLTPEARASIRDLRIPSQINGLAVTTIGNGAFLLSSITNAILPASVTTIEHSAFHASRLQTIEMPGVQTIVSWAFDSCRSLTSINLPDSIQTINNGTFYLCTSLESITLPDNLKNHQ